MPNCIKKPLRPVDFLFQHALFIKAIAVRGVHKEVHRAVFQSMHKQQGELYQGYIAKLKAKAELCQYMMVAAVCKDDLCNCSGHKKAAILQGRDGGDPASGMGVQQGAPGEAVVRDGQPAHISTNINIYQHISTYVNIYQHVSTCINIY